MENLANNFKSITWDITTKCNLHCKHCYVAEEYDLHNKRRNLNLTEIIDIISKLKKEHVNNIHFLGGEPFIRKDFYEIIRICKKEGFTVSVGTNGTLLNDKMILKLSDLGVNKLMFSLDGASAQVNDTVRGQGVYDLVLRNIKSAIKISSSKSMLIGITFTANKLNYKELPELFKLALGLKINELYIVPIQRLGEYKNNEKLLEANEFEFMNYLDEAINIYYEDIKKQNLVISSGLKYWPLVILNTKYPNCIRIDKLALMCNGGKHYFVIQGDGQPGPCFAYIDEFVNTYDSKKKNKVLNPEYLQKCTENDIDNLNVFKSFYKFKKNPCLKNPCTHCPYFKVECEPCPIKYKKIDNIDQCIWAEKKQKELDAEFIKYSYKFSQHYSLIDNCIIRNIDSYKIRIGKRLKYVIEVMKDNNYSVSYILENCFQNKLEYNEKKNIIHIILQLYMYGILVKNIKEK